jgi:hypothetical protein
MRARSVGRPPMRSPAAAIRPGLAGLAAILPRCAARARWRRCRCACELAPLAALGLCACVLTLLAALRLRARSADSPGRSREQRDEEGIRERENNHIYYAKTLSLCDLVSTMIFADMVFLDIVHSFHD